MNNNYAQLKAAVNIVDIIGQYVSLTKKGSEYVGFCPFHSDKKPSLQVNERKQVYACFACADSSGKNGGDVIAFLQRQNLDHSEIVNVLNGKSLSPGKAVKLQAKVKKEKSWKQLLPPNEASKIFHYKHGKPDQIWKYKNKSGQLVGYICRFNMPDGEKEVLPFTYGTDGTKKGWRWRGFRAPRVLYNRHLLDERPKATVVVVEGEKTADACNRLLPHAIAVTWIGGSNAVDKAEWSPLSGRKVLYWPDADKWQKYGKRHPLSGTIKPWIEQPGNKAMAEIHELIGQKVGVAKWIWNPLELPHKWDIADPEDWTPAATQTWVRANLMDVDSAINKGAQLVMNDYAPQNEIKGETPAPDIPPTMAEAIENESIDPTEYKTYFQFLGYEKEGNTVKHCFFVVGTRTVQRFTAGKLCGISSLLSLAPLDYWEGSFVSKRGTKVQTDMATNWMVRYSESVGFFDPNKMRGRGAWVDKKRIVLHVGECLYVNGKRVELGRFKSKFIYEASPALEFHPKSPLSAIEASKLKDLVGLLNWDRDVNTYLLLGWCIIAPFCGALSWRPHIWITGPAGTGKSWIFQQIVRPLLGHAGLAVQSETTEPGLRQLLGNDALPVVFDEAEGEDQRGQERVQKVLGLMRASSTSDGGIIAKGSAGGSAQSYVIRSSFAFASIGMYAAQQSDKTRITVLGLNNGRTEERKSKRWAKLQKMHLEFFNDNYIDRLHTRTLQLMPVILENTKTFAAATASVLGDQRIGDQLGALLAGAYSLVSSKTISFQDAVKWVVNKDWDEERALDESKDEMRLLYFLMERVVKVDGTLKGSVERTISELILLAVHELVDDPNVTDDLAISRLKRLGIKVDWADKTFTVSNNSNQVKHLLRGSPWSINHYKILERIPGSQRTNTIFFAPGIRSRGVAIPINMLTDAEEENKQKSETSDLYN